MKGQGSANVSDREIKNQAAAAAETKTYKSTYICTTSHQPPHNDIVGAHPACVEQDRNKNSTRHPNIKSGFMRISSTHQQRWKSNRGTGEPQRRTRPTHLTFVSSVRGNTLLTNTLALPHTHASSRASRVLTKTSTRFEHRWMGTCMAVKLQARHSEKYLPCERGKRRGLMRQFAAQQNTAKHTHTIQQSTTGLYIQSNRTGRPHGYKYATHEICTKNKIETQHVKQGAREKTK